MDGVGVSFWEEGLARGHPVVMEPEGLRTSWAPLEYNLLSWAYWTPGARVWNVMDKKEMGLTVYMLINTKKFLLSGSNY
jgi:hypothetical protein